MKRNLFFMALSAMALVTSCSNDEVTEISDSNAIKFDVTAGNVTRAIDVFCNNKKPSSFKVWADIASDASSYFAGDDVSKNGTTWESSTKRYWPSDNLFFYASNVSLTKDNNDYKVNDFTVNSNVNSQVDLLYAVNKGTKVDNAYPGVSKSTTPVSLNFRHALSQIVFKAKNVNEHLYVKVDGVALYNVETKATYTLPTDNTFDNIDDHLNTTTTDPASTTRGTWTYPTTPVWGGYQITNLTAVELNGSLSASSGNQYKINDVANLTDLTDNNNTVTNDNNVLLLLPQQTKTEDGKTVAQKDKLVLNSSKTKPAGYTKSTTEGEQGTFAANSNDVSYFLVKCAIANIAGSTFDSTTDKYLWGSASATKWVIIPASFPWEQGKKYIYTFVFGNGNGGYNPDPEDPDPDPVLVPITYTVSVDDFIKGEFNDVKVDTDGK